MSSITKLLFALYNRFRNLILYGIIGGFSATIDLLIFYILTNFLGVFYLAANTFSVIVGITISFSLNKKYNFRVTDKVVIRFLIFITVGLGGLLLSSALLYFFIDILIFDKVISKALSIVFVVLIQFILNKHLTFKKQS